MALLKTIFILSAAGIAHWIYPVGAYELHSRKSASSADHVKHRFKSFDRIRHRLDRYSNNNNQMDTGQVTTFQ